MTVAQIIAQVAREAGLTPADLPQPEPEGPRADPAKVREIMSRFKARTAE